MYLVKYCLFCLVIAIVMAVVFKRKFEEAVITVQLGIITLLYVFYVLDILEIGFYFICIALLLSVIWAVYTAIRYHRVRETLKLVVNPALIVYFMLLFLIYLTVRGNSVSLIDELHLWGGMPKILFYQKGKLQLKEAMLLGYADYIPGMPLYLYFLEKLNGTFQEALLYFGYAALGAAMMLQMCGRIRSFKKWYGFPVIIVVMYLLPLTFFNSIYNDYAIYYKSLHVDAILALTVGYAAWLLVQKPWKCIFDTITYSLSLAFLVLLKSSGIAFAMILIVSMLLYIFVYERQELKKRHIWAGVCLPLVVYIIWSACLKLFTASDSVGYSITDILNFSFMREFLSAMATKSILQPRNAGLSVYCTFLSCMLWLLTITVLSWLIVKKRMGEKEKILKWAFATLMVSLIIFIIGLYGLCVGPFHSRLLSYARYICTALAAFLCFIVMNFVYEFPVLKGCVFLYVKGTMGKKILGIVFALDLLVLGIFFPLYRPSEIQYPKTALNDADKIESVISEVFVKKETAGWNRAVMIVDKGYDSYSPDLHLYLHRRLYFDLIDEGIQISGTLYFDDDIVNESDTKDGKVFSISAEKTWAECDYVCWVHYVDDSSKTINLYEVVSRDSNNICLHQVRQCEIK